MLSCPCMVWVLHALWIGEKAKTLNRSCTQGYSQLHASGRHLAGEREHLTVPLRKQNPCALLVQPFAPINHRRSQNLLTGLYELLGGHVYSEGREVADFQGRSKLAEVFANALVVESRSLSTSCSRARGCARSHKEAAGEMGREQRSDRRSGRQRNDPPLPGPTSPTLEQQRPRAAPWTLGSRAPPVGIGAHSMASVTMMAVRDP